MHELIKKVEAQYRKPRVVDVRSGDTVRVHQKVREGNKERVQIFEGVVIRTDRKGSLTSRITVRRIASGVGVEKSYLMHSPLVLKVEVMKRSKVRRNYLSFLRQRSGKSARLSAVAFDKARVNDVGSNAEASEDAPEVYKADKLDKPAKVSQTETAEQPDKEPAKAEATK